MPTPQLRAEAAAALRLDADAEIARIADQLRGQVAALRRRGLVVAVSGGIDSSVCAALAVRALGSRRVVALALPERDSDPRSLQLARELAGTLDIPLEERSITPLLEAAGCYRHRDEAIRGVVPEFGEGWGAKLVVPGDRLNSDTLTVTALAVQPPGGEVRTARLPADAYLAIVAATNFKQRIRTMLAYHEADRRHYAVCGTPNRLEYDQGFFVKGGDGLADVKPIAHLYKTQVYQLADALGVPRRIRERPPTTDTFSLPQSQEEFYFAMPALAMDLVLFAHNAGRDVVEAAAWLGLRPEQVARAYADLEQKRATTRYLHEPPLLAGAVPEIRTTKA